MLKKKATLGIEDVSERQKTKVVFEEASVKESLTVVAENEPFKSVFGSISENKRFVGKRKCKISETGSFKKARIEKESETGTIPVFDEMWNRYKHGWCAGLKSDQDTTPKPIKTIGEIPPLEKKKK